MIFGTKQDKWHSWFAWYPVHITEMPYYNQIAWLHLLERKRPSLKYPWEYRVYA